MQGKLIIIEAGDGCGKATQTKALFEHLQKDGQRVHKIEYPDYASESSALVKMYLNGDFGKKVEDVDAYAASTFYAVDRYASFRMKWKKWYDAGDVIIADRYTTSNMVHQAVKFSNLQEREAFLTWLWDLEFVKMGLPIPSMVLFLEMAPEFSERLITNRSDKLHQVRDIHEQDQSYLQRCHAAYCQLAKKYGWFTVPCVKNKQLKSIEEIHGEIYALVSTVLLK